MPSVLLAVFNSVTFGVCLAGDTLVPEAYFLFCRLASDGFGVLT